MQSQEGAWEVKKEVKFEFKVEDPTLPKDLIFVIRNNNDYPYSNLFVKAYIKDQNQRVFAQDTLNYVLAKPNGEWLGEGFGETKEIKFLFKKRYRFPHKGTFVIGFNHAMRVNRLNGIEDVGIIIENTP